MQRLRCCYKHDSIIHLSRRRRPYPDGKFAQKLNGRVCPEPGSKVNAISNALSRGWAGNLFGQGVDHWWNELGHRLGFHVAVLKLPFVVALQQHGTDWADGQNLTPTSQQIFGSSQIRCIGAIRKSVEDRLQHRPGQSRRPLCSKTPRQVD